MAFDIEDLRNATQPGVELSLRQRAMLGIASNTDYEEVGRDKDEVRIIVPDTSGRNLHKTEPAADTDAAKKAVRSPAVPAADEIAAEVKIIRFDKRITSSQKVAIDDLIDGVLSPQVERLLSEAVSNDMQDDMDTDFLVAVRKGVPSAQRYGSSIAVENDDSQSDWGLPSTASDVDKFFQDLRRMQARLQKKHVVDTGYTDYQPYMIMSPDVYLTLTLADMDKGYLTLLEPLIQTGAALNNAQFAQTLFGFRIFVSDRIGTVQKNATQNQQNAGVGTDVNPQASDGELFDPVIIGVPQAVSVAAKPFIVQSHPSGSISDDYGARYNFYQRWGMLITEEDLLFRYDMQTR